MNPPVSPDPEQITAVLGATLIDGRDGAPMQDSAVVVHGSRIVAVGRRGSVEIPFSAERIDATGLYLLPGMMDGHFHSPGRKRLRRLLYAGFTAFRDPGQHISAYDDVLSGSEPAPRAFLTGPHLDREPHAYPHNAADVATETAARSITQRLQAEGASAIKIYFRLPLELIRVVCETADALGIPATAHLELVRADAALRAGIDGIEHTTSLGTALTEESDAREFEAGVRASNEFRRDGRYWLWSRLRFDDNPRVKPLLDLMLEKSAYLTPTLQTFEVLQGEDGATPERLIGFARMQQFTGIAARAGIPIVASSHGRTPDQNWRELELLVGAGLTPMEAIESTTRVAAEFFGAQDRLGTIEVGKLADLVLLRENPLQNITSVRTVSRVMLNGRWVRPADD